jgi:hypothetical protein
VALVHRLEEGHLGLARQVYVLCTISDELHKSTGHDCLVLLAKKKNLACDPTPDASEKKIKKINLYKCLP